MKNIIINGKSVSPVDLKGQRVVTLAMIDDLHGRPKDTARKRFNENKQRFVEGEDYFVRNPDEAKELGFTAPNGLTLLTESGYLMLVKSFTDDLAWTVQRELVNVYFRSKGKRTRVPAIDTAFIRYHRIASLRPNADPNQCWLAAGRATYEKYGENPCETLGITSLAAPDQTNHKTATEIGKMIGLSAQAVNKALLGMRYQVKVENPSSTSSSYEMLEDGKSYGRMYDETRKRGKGSQQVLKWSPDVAEKIKEHLQHAEVPSGSLAAALAQKATPRLFAQSGGATAT
ncbi:ORF6N domain-containing protein [Komagataeibacter sp. FXV2]|nr:ORF6N domain-containing protein [Komagataeibacter sp. FXV2]